MGTNTGRTDCRRLLSNDGSPSRNSYRLAFAIHRYFDFGGLQRDFRRVALACADRGHEVHVVTTDWSGDQPSNLVFHLLRLPGFTNHERSRQFGDAVQRLARRESFDCLVGFNKMPGLDVYFCGDSCLAEHLQKSKFRHFLRLPRYRTYLELEGAVFGKACDAELLLISETETQRIIQHYGPSESRLHLLPAGIDRERLQPTPNDDLMRASLRRDLKIPDEHLMILMVGSSFKRKGVDRAILAVGSLPERERQRTSLVIVGKDKAAPFSRLARRLHLADRVTFAGGRDNVRDFYRSADLFLHPARTENTGLILLEAMYCGLPVLATEECGYACHILRGQAGLVCPEPFSQPVLNRLLAQMLPAEARVQWKQNALAYCRSTDIYTMVEKMIDVIVSRAQRNRQAA